MLCPSTSQGALLSTVRATKKPNKRRTTETYFILLRMLRSVNNPIQLSSHFSHCFLPGRIHCQRLPTTVVASQSHSPRELRKKDTNKATSSVCCPGAAPVTSPCESRESRRFDPNKPRHAWRDRLRLLWPSHCDQFWRLAFVSQLMRNQKKRTPVLTAIRNCRAEEHQ